MSNIDDLPLPDHIRQELKNKEIHSKDLENLHPEHKPYSRDDKGMARLYSIVFEDKHRFNADSNTWMEYDGKIWREDPGGHHAGSDYMDLHDRLVAYSTGLYLNSKNEEEKKSFDEYRKFIDKYGYNRKMKDVLECAKNINVIHTEVFNRKRGILNVQNGTLNLKTGILQPHDPDDMLTHICNANFTDMESTEEYKAFCKFVLEIADDREDLAEFIQRILGYGLTDSSKQECGFMFLGVKSRNGKTTLLDAVSNAMGDYSVAMNPATLTRKQFTNSSAPSPDVTALRDARLVRVGEPEKGMILDAERFKAWTGNSKIRAREMYQKKELEFDPRFKIIFDTNHELEISDMTIFRSDRIVVVPFDRYFSEKDRDLGLKERFRQPKYSDAILYWCYKGYLHYSEKGVGLKNKPESVKIATESFKKRSDKMAQFMEDCMHPSNRNASAKATYETYYEWCRETKKNPLGRNNFFTELRNLGIYADRGKVGGIDTKGIVVGYEITDYRIPGCH